jgi:hypothetical protein
MDDNEMVIANKTRIKGWNEEKTCKATRSEKKSRER